MKKLLLMTSLLLLLSACASPYPLGMDETQWNALTVEERQALLLKQQQYREEQRLVQMKADAEARKLRIQQEMVESRRLEKLYNHPQDGNVIMVNLLGGEYRHGKRSKRLMEATYQVARGETKQIELILEDTKKHYTSTETAYLSYDVNGNGVYLSLDNPGYNSSKRIALLRDGHWPCGSNYTKNLHGSYEKLIGVKVFVKESGSRCRGNHQPYRRY
ncbi:hypothetical protein [Thiomicrorhabdus arctica]|uniref:hypothetical protein n=1 Tax=Thiomicrorhabdus arctica TaxID=131540 RepID=UPI000364594E|nr:hypothetical protein [Thiomicrorhabdus arctica]